MAHHFSDKREPENKSKVHHSVPDLNRPNKNINQGNEPSYDRSHIEGAQSPANYNKPAPFSKKRK